VAVAKAWRKKFSATETFQEVNKQPDHARVISRPCAKTKATDTGY
jgi:hypothetical protein